MTLNSDIRTGNSPIALSKEEPTRMGVFICNCEDKVSDILDVEKLVTSSAELSGVVYAGNTRYWCSAAGRDCLEATIRSEGLERVIIAGCSRRTHQRLFQETVANAGLSPDLLGLVNIREGCAWPHRREHKAATLRARDQIAMEVAHTAALTLRPLIRAEITPAALVIGGGGAGMTAALELAEAGFPVTLIERSTKLGGTALIAAPELAADLIAAVQTHPRITLYVESHITHLEGSVGAYHITIVQRAKLEVCQTFGVIVVATGAPSEETRKLASLLRLPQDAQGLLPESRVRLRPGSYAERGIYVCGSAHYPCDPVEAQFQAYSAASRALHHLQRESVTAHGPAAQVAPEKCNGCGDCLNVCPFAAVTMVERPPYAQHQPLGPAKALGLSSIDPLLCTGCGNCVSVCPVGAVTVAGWTDAQLEAQMQVALPGTVGRHSVPNPQPRILIFACEWSGYAAAELAGAQKLSYPANVRMIRLDCSGRLQPGLILKAFEIGAAGVLVLGCAPKLCHYERGNERAAVAYDQVEALVDLLGLPSARLQQAWIPPDDGRAFAQLVTSFVEGVEKAVE
jgi:heterodisulfide reductase subunit A-like polyferredoxin/coenzyme F420-reducing hydrogenase delta subunit